MIGASSETFGKKAQDVRETHFYGNCRNIDTYEKLNKLGEGTYGIVYKARDKLTNQIVALKKIRLYTCSYGFPLSFQREISILKAIKHENIISMLNVVTGSSIFVVYLAMEYCSQDMEQAMAQTLRTSFKGYNLSEGHLHDNQVVHRDLKLSNILISSNGVLKIADLGIARRYTRMRRAMTPNVTTIWYRAFEILLGAQWYGPEVDMWSVGCILGELLLHKPLLPGRNEIEQVELIVNLLGVPSDDILKSFNISFLPKECTFESTFSCAKDSTKIFLKSLLDYCPRKRITSQNALNSTWFKEYPYPCHPAMLPLPECKAFSESD